MNQCSLQKGKSRNPQPQIKKEVFKDSLTDLFDISHSNALQIIKIHENKKFLLAQREKGRKACMIEQIEIWKNKNCGKINVKSLFNIIKKRSKKVQDELLTPDTND